MNRIPSPPPMDARPSERTHERPSLPPGLQDDGRVRNRTGEQVVDPYNIDDIKNAYAPTNGDPSKGNIQYEVDFEWKAYETYGKKNYSQYHAHEDQGWRPVMHSDFPGRFAPAGEEGSVRVNDMILMHRPMRLTAQARKEDYGRATRAMQVHREKMAETPEGQHTRMKPVIRSSIEPLPREAIEVPD